MDFLIKDGFGPVLGIGPLVHLEDLFYQQASFALA
jgi:hypothetical protein